jgi:hypothetical protein
MSAALSLLTHEEISAQLVTVSEVILKQCMTAIALVSVPADIRPEVPGKYADLIHTALLAQEKSRIFWCSPMCTEQQPTTWPGIF